MGFDGINGREAVMGSGRHETPDWNSDIERRSAVEGRDAQADGRFVYAVRTTGIYCRPSCPSRRPRAENIRFFDTSDEAKRAGFRPCKRCTPEASPDASAERGASARIAALCRLIETSAQPLSLKQLAAHAELSPFHLQRTFKQTTGLTPRAYAAAVRARRASAELARRGKSVTDAIYAAGFESGGRFYESSNARLGMTPTRLRAGGAGLDIHYAYGRASLGDVLVARTDKGICAIYLGASKGALLEDLRKRFPGAVLTLAGQEFAQLLESVIRLVERPSLSMQLPLDIRGTAFQERVWEELRRIPAGATASYGEIAARIGAPSASRAVAQACASNQLAIAIPCHRVVRGDGGLSGYRWGSARKRALLEREAPKDSGARKDRV